MAQQNSEPKPEALKAKPATPVGMFIRDMPAGTKLKLNTGALVEVVENAKDGGWLFARYLQDPDGSESAGEEEWIFFGDIQAEME